MFPPLARLEAAIAPHRERLATPALIIDVDAVDHNIAAVIRRCGGPRGWRPHIKTIKQASLLHRLFAHGVVDLKCATLEELALALDSAAAAAVTADILVAYPLHEAAFHAANALADRSPEATVAFLADSPAHARRMAQWADGSSGGSSGGSSARAIYLDVDLGMGRTGTVPARWAAHAPALVAEFAEHTSLRIAGLHGYDGHLGAADHAAAAAGYDQLCGLAAAYASAGCEVAELVTSGSHTYAAALAHAGLRAGTWRHTIAPGTIVLRDRRCVAATADLGLRQAAFVATRVISGDGARRITTDAGSKAISPDCRSPSCEIVGWPELHPGVPSEEHLPLRVGGLTTPALGSLLWLVPEHVCTTVNLYRTALLIRAHEVVGESPIASGRSLWLAAPPALAGVGVASDLGDDDVEAGVAEDAG